jgi:hypothetical protein
VLVPAGLNFFMWSISAGNGWFKFIVVLHKISGDCSTEIQHKGRSVICILGYLYIPRLFLYKSKFSECTSLGLHIPFCLL